MSLVGVGIAVALSLLDLIRCISHPTTACSATCPGCRACTTSTTIPPPPRCPASSSIATTPRCSSRTPTTSCPGGIGCRRRRAARPLAPPQRRGERGDRPDGHRHARPTPRGGSTSGASACPGAGQAGPPDRLDAAGFLDRRATIASTRRSPPPSTPTNVGAPWNKGTAALLDLEAIRLACVRHGVTRLRVFGSATTEHFDQASDVDFLVDFAPDNPNLFHDYFDLKFELERITGRPVDLVDASAVRNPYFRASALRPLRGTVCRMNRCSGIPLGRPGSPRMSRPPSATRARRLPRAARSRATERQIELVGEALNNLRKASPVERVPDVHKIIGMRNVSCTATPR